MNGLEEGYRTAVSILHDDVRDFTTHSENRISANVRWIRKRRCRRFNATATAYNDVFRRLNVYLKSDCTEPRLYHVNNNNCENGDTYA